MLNRGFNLKKYTNIFLILLLVLCNSTLASETIDDSKQKAYALYATKNYTEALNILESLPLNQKDEEVLLMIANIAEENENDNLAIQNLNKALDKNISYYKAYYNLGCIFARKKSYLLAMNNFELAIKNNKNFASAYYNLACCQIKFNNYDEARKNLQKVIELEPKNKDAYYNLALCYKMLNKEKQAKKILKLYEALS